MEIYIFMAWGSGVSRLHFAYLGQIDPKLKDPLLDHPDEGGKSVAAGQRGSHGNVTVLKKIGRSKQVVQ